MPSNTNCDHHEAVNKIEIRVKTRCHVVPTSRFIVKHNIEGVFVCNVPSTLFEAMVTELTVHETETGETALADTCCHANDLIFRLRAHVEAVRSIKVMGV